MVNYKKPIALFLTVVMMVSLVLSGISPDSILSVKAASTPFTAQHIDVNFDGYSSTLPSTNFPAISSGVLPTTEKSFFSIKNDTDNGNYLHYYINNQHMAGGKTFGNSFIVNSEGNIDWSSSATSTTELDLVNGATYRMSLKYRMPTCEYYVNKVAGTAVDPTSTDGFDELTYTETKMTLTLYAYDANTKNTGSAHKATTLSNVTGGTLNNAGNGIRLSTTEGDEWSTVVLDFTVNGFYTEDTTKKHFLRMAFSGWYAVGYVANVEFDIDNIQVDRIDTATVTLAQNGTAISGSDVELTYAPAATYNEHLFSSTGDFAGGVLNATTGEYESLETALAVSRVTANGVSDEATFTGLYDSLESLTSIPSIPAATGASYYAKYTTANTSFTPQHAFVDFENYELDITNNHLTCTNLQTSPWSVETAGDNKYLDFSFDSTYLATGKENFGSGKQHNTSFLVNAVGKVDNQSADKYFVLQSGAKYRVSFKYKTTMENKVQFVLYAMKGTKNISGSANYVQQTLDNATSGLSKAADATAVAPKATEWTDYTIEFTATTTDAWSNILRFGFSVSNVTEYDLAIDDLQVDRIATVTIKDKNDAVIGTLTGAPACDYNQYLFSSTGNFEGDTVPALASAITSTTTATGWDYKNAYTNPNFNKALTTKTTGAVTEAGLYRTINMLPEDEVTEPKFVNNDGVVYYKKSEDSTGQLSFLDFEGVIPARGDVFVGNANDNTAADYDNLGLRQYNVVYSQANTAKWAFSNDEYYTGSTSIAWQGKVSEDDGIYNRGLYVGGGTGFTYGKSYEISFYVKKGADNDAQSPVIDVNVTLTGASALSGSSGNEKSAITSVALSSEQWQKVTLKYTPADTAIQTANNYHSSGTATTISDSVGPMSPIIRFDDVNGNEYGVPCVIYVDTLMIKEIDNTTVTFDYCDDSTKEYVYGYEGEEIDLITPKRPGYTFEGWFTEKSYTNKVEGAYDVTASDITFYAKWQEYEAGFWSGDSSQPAGSGTEDDPYLISNSYELAWITENVCSAFNNTKTGGKYFELTNDIYINDITDPKWKEKAKSWYTATNTFYDFNGYLDGKGYTIYGLYVNKLSSEEEISNKIYTMGGLFPAIGDGAVIKNLALDESYICANAAGGFAGILKNSSVTAKPSIIGCYIGAGVTVESKGENIHGNQNFLGAGGFVGIATQPLEFRYCYSKATAIAEGHGRINNTDGSGRNVFVEDTIAGTFVGFGKTNDKIEFRSCYSAPTDPEIRMLGVTDTGSPISQNSYATVNVYRYDTKDIITYVQPVSDLNMIGENAREFMPNLDYDKVYKIVDGDTPILRVFDVNDPYYGYDLENHNDPYERDVIEGTPGEVWSGGIASQFAGGDGSEEHPYEIATAEQLFYFVDIILDSSWGSNDSVNNKNYTTIGKYYKLTADIYLNDVSKSNWYEGENLNQWVYANKHSQCLQGTLDGDGHVVYGLYFNVDVEQRIGLIPSIGQYGVIKNLALASSYIVNESTLSNYAAGICAMTESRGNARSIPRFESCCVADDVTIISGYSAGGILGFCAQAAYFENCYSVASLSGQFTRCGGMSAYGPIKEDQYYYLDDNDQPTDKAMKSIMINCYVADSDKRFVTGSLGYDNVVDATNCYTLSSAGEYSTVISLSKMTGDKAKTNMTGFDFANVWSTVEKSTPALKIFADRDDLDVSKLVRFKGPVTVTFETYGGTTIAPVVGEPGEKLTLPTPKRDSDVFDGWYVYSYETWDVPFTYNFIPDDDVTLYAKWTSHSLRQGFEKYNYIAEDGTGMEEDYLHYTSTYFEYDVANVYSGSRSLWRRGNVDEYKNVSLCDENTVTLIPGAEYKLSMWVKLMEAPSEDDAIYLAWLQAAAWAKEELATEKVCDLSTLKVGEWVEVTYTFIAYGEYLGLRTPGVSMFIDEVNAIYTGNSGLNTKAVITPLSTITTVIEDYYIDEEHDGNSDSASTVKKIKKIYKKRIVGYEGLAWWVYVLIGVGALIVIAACVVVFIIIRKKKQQKE